MELFRSIFNRYIPILDSRDFPTKYEKHKTQAKVRKKIYTSNGDYYYVDVVGNELEYVLCYLYSNENKIR